MLRMILRIVFSLFIYYGQSKEVRIVMKNGTEYMRRSHFRCQSQYYNIKCYDSGTVIVPIRNIFGLKPPAVQQHFSCMDDSQLWYHPECCYRNASSDCMFESKKDMDYLVYACGHRRYCTGHKAVRATASKNQCTYKNFPISDGFKETQYVNTEYICASGFHDVVLCPIRKTSLSGKGIFLKSEKYPLFAGKSNGFQCKCHISTVNRSTLSVYTVDLRLCRGGNRSCGQRFTLSTYDKKTKNILRTAHGSYLAFEQLSNTSQYMTLSFTQQNGTISFFIWLYFYANGNDMNMICDTPVVFSNVTTIKGKRENVALKEATRRNKIRRRIIDSPKPKGHESLCAQLCNSNINGSTDIEIEECLTMRETIRSMSAQQQYDQTFDYIAMGCAAVGGVIFASCVAFFVNRTQSKQKKRLQESALPIWPEGPGLPYTRAQAFAGSMASSSMPSVVSESDMHPGFPRRRPSRMIHHSERPIYHSYDYRERMSPRMVSGNDYRERSPRRGISYHFIDSERSPSRMYDDDYRETSPSSRMYDDRDFRDRHSSRRYRSGSRESEDVRSYRDDEYRDLLPSRHIRRSESRESEFSQNNSTNEKCTEGFGPQNAKVVLPPEKNLKSGSVSRKRRTKCSRNPLPTVSEKPELKEELVDRIAEKMKGNPSFLRALLHLPLSNENNMDSPKDIKDVLRQLGSQALKRIDESSNKMQRT